MTFVRQMGRLAQARIPVYLIWGNHDAKSQITKRLKHSGFEPGLRPGFREFGHALRAGILAPRAFHLAGVPRINGHLRAKIA